MPRMDGTGPEGKGSQSGRKLGFCVQLSKEELLKKLGQGQGKRRKACDSQGETPGRRLKSNIK
jgi:hypothetical protein